MGSRRTTIINTSTTVAPQQPSSQPLVQSGRISGLPVTYTVGASRRVGPAADFPVRVQPYNPFRTAWSSVPYVPFRPRNVHNPVVRPTVPSQTVTNNSLSSAGVIKDQVCNDILSDPVSGVDSFVITGNGKATRFRFPVAGAPSEIAVTNNSTGAVVSGSDYTVLVRSDSVSWLIFDTAPADGISFNVKYVLGDSPFIRNVRVGTWTDWLVQLNNLQRQLLSAKTNAQTNQSYRFGYSTFSNRVPESAVYDEAIEAVIQLKSQIKAPGSKMDLKSIAAACNNIEDQLAKIGAGTGKRSQADSTVGGPLITSPSITRGANIVFDFDDRYTSFSPSGGEFYYNGKLYTRQFDSQVGANYFDLNAGRVLPPPPSYQSDNGGSENFPSGPTRPVPNPRYGQPTKAGTGITGGKTGVRASDLAPASSPRPESRPTSSGLRSVDSSPGSSVDRDSDRRSGGGASGGLRA